MSLYEDEVELYDIAFDWDVTDEVDWLLGRLGAHCRLVLEPGCGSGRMLEAFARRGVEVVGLELSASMAAFARDRLAQAGVRAEVVLADMTEFDLGRTFDGAICPINTLGHLGEDGLARHLECVAAHLEPGARYLVQVGLVDRDERLGGSYWEAERNDTKLKVAWEGVLRDWSSRRQEERARIEIVAGARQGEVVEHTYVMTIWTPETWRAAIAASPFAQTATYDGNVRERPRVEPGQPGGLLWHELVRR
jgi:cyclopropane fatty-acyl-phospholipid synthase-like methyltransferase